jgi:dihydroorotate dehydrogenase (fumarate)
MNLNTKYLGHDLRSPVVVSASPLSSNIENLKEMEEFGAGAVVLHSVFEEQLRAEAAELADRLDQGSESFAEALSYFPKIGEYRLGPDEYLRHIEKAKKAVKLPIIGSLNGATLGGWTEFAKKIEGAGADALELNIYTIPTNAELSSAEIEAQYVDIVKAVRGEVKIPVAVKLSPFFTNTAAVAKRLVDAGANGLVLFNRFYQPDVDLEERVVKPQITWSTPFAQRLPLRWIAIMSGRTNANLAATSGIHEARDVLKAVAVGADVAMVCSTLYKNGLGHLRTINRELSQWLERHEFKSLGELRGSLSQRKVEDPTAFERAQFVKAVTTYESR